MSTPRPIDPFASAPLGPITLHNRIIKSATFEGVMPDALVTEADLERVVLDLARTARGCERVAILAKLNMVDAIPGGLREEESLRVARMLLSDGTLDALVLTGGSCCGNPMFLFRGDGPRKDFAANLPWLMRIGFKLVGRKFMPDTPFEEAYFRPVA